MVTVAPSRLTLTTTPSIAPSVAELTCPVSAAGACACAGTATDTTVIAAATKANKMVRDGIGVSSISGRPFGHASLHANVCFVREPRPAGNALQEGSGRERALD